MLSPSFKKEQKLWRKGYALVAGVDEVGRGAWAGPLVAGAVIFASGSKLVRGVRDSKLLTPRAREDLFGIITRTAKLWAIGVVGASVIDRVGIVEANRRAMRMAIDRLSHCPDYVLTDAFPLTHTISCEAVTEGDGRVQSIAAASIVAKVWRDNFMRRLHRRYPAYGFDRHKGYGTRAHEQAIRRYGMSVAHRCSFVPGRCLPR